MVIVKRVAEEPAAIASGTSAIDDGEESIHVDDVLEAHELLRDYVGDVHGLFEKVSGH